MIKGIIGASAGDNRPVARATELGSKPINSPSLAPNNETPRIKVAFTMDPVTSCCLKSSGAAIVIAVNTARVNTASFFHARAFELFFIYLLPIWTCFELIFLSNRLSDFYRYNECAIDGATSLPTARSKTPDKCARFQDSGGIYGRAKIYLLCTRFDRAVPVKPCQNRPAVLLRQRTLPDRP